MRDSVPELMFKLSKKAAFNMQQTFYSFIHATEHSSNIKNIAGDIKHAQQFTNDANTMRGYVVVVKHAKLESTIRFINRDLNPATKSIREQLKAQLSTNEDKAQFFASLGTDDD